jgi:hypothetical protein
MIAIVCTQAMETAMGMLTDFGNRRAIHAMLTNPTIVEMLAETGMAARTVMVSIYPDRYVRHPGEGVFARMDPDQPFKDLHGEKSAVLTKWSGAPSTRGVGDRWILSFYEKGMRTLSSSTQDYTSAVVHFDERGNATRVDLALTTGERQPVSRMERTVDLSCEAAPVVRLHERSARAEPQMAGLR